MMSLLPATTRSDGSEMFCFSVLLVSTDAEHHLREKLSCRVYLIITF